MSIDDLTPGPIRHVHLSAELVSRVETLRMVLAEVFPVSEQEWLDSFRRDLSPEREISWWERLAGCYTRFVANCETSADQRQAAFKIIFGAFSGLGPQDLAADLAKLSVSDRKDLAAILRSLNEA